MDHDVVPPKRVVLVVDLATFAEEPDATRLSCLNAAARCLSCCYVLNTEVEWGFMFIDTRVLPTAYGKRVLDICSHSDIVQGAATGSDEHRKPFHLSRAGPVGAESLAEFGRLLCRLGNGSYENDLAATNPQYARRLRRCAQQDGERTELNVAHLLQHLECVWNVFLRDDPTTAEDENIVFLFSSAPTTAEAYKTFVGSGNVDGVEFASVEGARKCLQQALDRQCRHVAVLGKMRTFWLDTGVAAPAPKEIDAWKWRVGIWKADLERYHYGVVRTCDVDDNGVPIHKVQYDHGKEEILYLESCKVDWVQPDAIAVAVQARAALQEKAQQDRASREARGGRVVEMGLRPNASPTSVTKALSDALSSVMRETFRGGLMGDARRLGGPLTPRQLGAHMASILGSGAEDCLVLPAPGLSSPDAGADFGPEDPLPLGQTVEEVAEALRVVTGEAKPPPAVAAKTRKHSKLAMPKDVPGFGAREEQRWEDSKPVGREPVCATSESQDPDRLKQGMDQQGKAHTKGRHSLRSQGERPSGPQSRGPRPAGQPPAPDWRQVGEYIWQNPQSDGSTMVQHSPVAAAQEALLTAVRARDACGLTWSSEGPSVHEQLAKLASDGQNIVLKAASKLLRLPQDAVLQAATSLAQSVPTTAAAVPPPEAPGCTGLVALTEALRSALLVQRMKDIPNDAPNRIAMVAMEVVLRLELGTIAIAGVERAPDAPWTHAELRPYELAFGELGVELAKAPNDADLRFVKHVLRPRYGQVLGGVIELYAEMAGGVSDSDSGNGSTADNSPNAHVSASEMDAGVSGSHRDDGGMSRFGKSHFNSQLGVQPSMPFGRPHSAGLQGSALGTSGDPHRSTSGAAHSGNSTMAGGGGRGGRDTSSRERGGGNLYGGGGSRNKTARPFLNAGAMGKGHPLTVTVGLNRRPSRAAQQAQAAVRAHGSKLRPSNTGAGGGPGRAASQLPQLQQRDSRMRDGGSQRTRPGVHQGGVSKPKRGAGDRRRACIPDTPGAKHPGDEGMSRLQQTPQAGLQTRVHKASPETLWIPDTGPRRRPPAAPAGGQVNGTSKRHLIGSIPLNDAIDDTADSQPFFLDDGGDNPGADDLQKKATWLQPAGKAAGPRRGAGPSQPAQAKLPALPQGHAANLPPLRPGRTTDARLLTPARITSPVQPQSRNKQQQQTPVNTNLRAAAYHLAPVSGSKLTRRTSNVARRLDALLSPPAAEVVGLAPEAAGAGSQPEPQTLPERRAGGADGIDGVHAVETLGVTTLPLGALNQTANWLPAHGDSTAGECSPFSQPGSRNGPSAQSEPSLAMATPVEKVPSVAPAMTENGEDTAGQLQDLPGHGLPDGESGAPAMSKAATTIAETPSEAYGVHQAMDVASQPTSPTACVNDTLQASAPNPITNDTPARAVKTTTSTRSQGGGLEAGDVEGIKLGRSRAQPGVQANNGTVQTRPGKSTVSHAADPATNSLPARTTRSGAKVPVGTRSVCTVSTAEVQLGAGHSNADGFEGTPQGGIGRVTRRGARPVAQGKIASDMQPERTPGDGVARKTRSKGALSEQGDSARKTRSKGALSEQGDSARKTRSKGALSEQGDSARKTRSKGALSEQGDSARKTRSKGALSEQVDSAAKPQRKAKKRASKGADVDGPKARRKKRQHEENSTAAKVQSGGPMGKETPTDGKGEMNTSKDAAAEEGRAPAKKRGRKPKSARRAGKLMAAVTGDGMESPPGGIHASSCGPAVDIFGAAAELPLVNTSQGGQDSPASDVNVPGKLEEAKHPEKDPFAAQGGAEDGSESPPADSDLAEAQRAVGAWIPSALSGGSSWQDAGNGCRGVQTTTPGSVHGAATMIWRPDKAYELQPLASGLATDHEAARQATAELGDVDIKELPFAVPVVSEADVADQTPESPDWVNACTRASTNCTVTEAAARPAEVALLDHNMEPANDNDGPVPPLNLSNPGLATPDNPGMPSHFAYTASPNEAVNMEHEAARAVAKLPGTCPGDAPETNATPDNTQMDGVERPTAQPLPPMAPADGVDPAGPMQQGENVFSLPVAELADPKARLKKGRASQKGSGKAVRGPYPARLRATCKPSHGDGGRPAKRRNGSKWSTDGGSENNDAANDQPIAMPNAARQDGSSKACTEKRGLLKKPRRKSLGCSKCRYAKNGCKACRQAVCKEHASGESSQVRSPSTSKRTSTVSKTKPAESAPDPIQVTRIATDLAQPGTPGPDASLSGCPAETQPAGVRKRSHAAMGAGSADPVPGAKRHHQTGAPQEKHAMQGAGEHGDSSGTTKPSGNVDSMPNLAFSDATVFSTIQAPAPHPEVQKQMTHASGGDDASAAVDGRALRIVEAMDIPQPVPRVQGQTGHSKCECGTIKFEDFAAGPSGMSNLEADGHSPPDAPQDSGCHPRQGSTPFQSLALRTQGTPPSILKRRKDAHEGPQGLVPLTTRRVSFNVAVAECSLEPAACADSSTGQGSDANPKISQEYCGAPSDAPTCLGGKPLSPGPGHNAEVLEGDSSSGRISANVGQQQKAVLPLDMAPAGSATGNPPLQEGGLENGRPAEPQSKQVASQNSSQVRGGPFPQEGARADGTTSSKSGREPTQEPLEGVPPACAASLATDSEDFHSVRETMTPASNADCVTPATHLLQSQLGQPHGNPSSGRGYQTRRNAPWVAAMSAEQAALAATEAVKHKTPEQAASHDRIQDVKISPVLEFGIPRRPRSKGQALQGDAKENAVDHSSRGETMKGGAAMRSLSASQPQPLEGHEGVGDKGQVPLQELPHMVQSPPPEVARKGHGEKRKAPPGAEQASVVPGVRRSDPGDAAQGEVEAAGLATEDCTPMKHPRTDITHAPPSATRMQTGSARKCKSNLPAADMSCPIPQKLGKLLLKRGGGPPLEYSVRKVVLIPPFEMRVSLIPVDVDMNTNLNRGGPEEPVRVELQADDFCEAADAVQQDGQWSIVKGIVHESMDL